MAPNYMPETDSSRRLRESDACRAPITSSVAAQCTEQRAVPKAISAIGDELKQLHNSVSELVGRLEPLMTPATPNNSVEKNGCDSTCVVADTLASFAREIRGIKEFVENAYSRVQL